MRPPGAEVASHLRPCFVAGTLYGIMDAREAGGLAMEERMAELADFHPARLARAGAVADEAVAAGLYGGVVVAVGNAAGTLWMHTAADSTPVSLDTIFPVASVTKPVVALAVMQLAEAGRLLLNDPVARRALAAAGHERITTGRNTYADRLQSMLDACGRGACEDRDRRPRTISRV